MRGHRIIRRVQPRRGAVQSLCSTATVQYSHYAAQSLRRTVTMQDRGKQIAGEEVFPAIVGGGFCVFSTLSASI
eukprot:8427277-Pyramimonas_sp.AAC.2